ncbi:MAG: hypothetical protein GY795_44265 [Desulfobacterales bacterium]|nr:hypothetical protein [Desulfobacterales bacterium]
MKNFKGPFLIDTSEKEPVYILIGKNRRIIRLSQASYLLLHGLDSGLSFDELAVMISKKTGMQYSPDIIRSAYQQIVSEVSDIEISKKRILSKYLFRAPVFSQEFVSKTASCFSTAFHPPVALGLFLFIISVAGYSFIYNLIGNITVSSIAAGFWWGYLLFIISAFFHELGHASACAFFRARPGEIGYTIYLFIPYFYSDVSSSWELRRMQRVIVDAGGIFFQAVVACFYIILFSLTDWPPFKSAIIMIGISSLYSIIPVFKADGYWMIADALGVVNLGQQRLKIFRHFCNRIRGRPAGDLPWPRLITCSIIFYTFISFGITGYIVWVLASRCL